MFSNLPLKLWPFCSSKNASGLKRGWKGLVHLLKPLLGTWEPEINIQVGRLDQCYDEGNQYSRNVVKKYFFFPVLLNLKANANFRTISPIILQLTSSKAYILASSITQRLHVSCIVLEPKTMSSALTGLSLSLLRSMHA